MHYNVPIHKDLDEKLYPFEQCKLCKICRPEAKSSAETSTQCDRCAMGSEPDRFQPNFKTEREVKLEGALSVLVELKQHKNQYGKTALYELAQPEAWKKAELLVAAKVKRDE